MVYRLLLMFAQDPILKDSDLPNIPKNTADASTIQIILSTAFLAAGGISVIFIVIGGLKYVLSTGDPASTKKAKDTILYAIIGLIFSLLAFVIVRIVTGQLKA